VRDATLFPLRREMRLELLESVVATKRVHLLRGLHTSGVLVAVLGLGVEHGPNAFAVCDQVDLKALKPQEHAVERRQAPTSL
jgi:hypothetical protein